MAKTLSAMIPPLIASFGGMMLYLLTVLTGELAWRPTAHAADPNCVADDCAGSGDDYRCGGRQQPGRPVPVQPTCWPAFIIIPMTLIINGESFIMFHRARCRLAWWNWGIMGDHRRHDRG